MASLFKPTFQRRFSDHFILEQVNAVDILSKDGDTLLMLAARNGLTDVVNELMKLNATVTTSKDAIASASRQAKEAGFQDVVDILGNLSQEVMSNQIKSN